MTSSVRSTAALACLQRSWGILASLGLALGSGCASASQSVPSTPATTATPVVCRTKGDFGPVAVSARAYDTRIGVAALKFSALSTTKQRPLEECGISAVVQRLAILRCDDDKNPFGGDRGDAHASRVGSVGPGGRCDAIIDEYQIRCPEAVYTVFADSYYCEGI